MHWEINADYVGSPLGCGTKPWSESHCDITISHPPRSGVVRGFVKQVKIGLFCFQTHLVESCFLTMRPSSHAEWIASIEATSRPFVQFQTIGACRNCSGMMEIIWSQWCYYTATGNGIPRMMSLSGRLSVWVAQFLQGNIDINREKLAV